MNGNRKKRSLTGQEHHPAGTGDNVEITWGFSCVASSICGGRAETTASPDPNANPRYFFFSDVVGFADAGVKANHDKSMTLSAKSLRDVLHEFLFGAIFFLHYFKVQFLLSANPLSFNE